MIELLAVCHLNEYKQSVTCPTLPYSAHPLLKGVVHVGQHFRITYRAVLELGSSYGHRKIRIEWAGGDDLSMKNRYQLCFDDEGQRNAVPCET